MNNMLFFDAYEGWGGVYDKLLGAVPTYSQSQTVPESNSLHDEEL